jgi:hypothetical protein
MPSNLSQIIIRMTDEQRAALISLTDEMNAKSETKISRAHVMLTALAEYAERQGVEFPKIESDWGGVR